MRRREGKGLRIVELDTSGISVPQTSAKNAIEFLEQLGLIDVEKIAPEVGGWPSSRVDRVAGELYGFLEQQRSCWDLSDETTLSPFSFLASASFRGDAGCCRPACQSEKLDVVAHYAAMYCDHLFFPIVLACPSPQIRPEDVRERLIRSVSALLELRPLIEKDIVRPMTSAIHYCPQCANDELAKFRDGMDVVRKQAQKHVAEFSFTAERFEDVRGLTVEMKGPEDFIEHGILISLYREHPNWLTRSLEVGERWTIPASVVKRAGLVERIFQRIAADVFFHRFFQASCNAAYLTNLRGEAEFLGSLSLRDALAQRTATMCAQLSHEIPLPMSLPLRTILKIRDDDYESFNLYRTTLTSVVRDHIQSGGATTQEEAKTIYRDVLEPTLVQMRLDAKRQHERWVRKSALTAGFALGVVTLGATGALQTPQVLSILGGATVVKLLDQLADAPKNQQITNSSLYFLLQLERQAKFRKS